MAEPRIDVYETESEVIAACEIPGLERREDVHIDVDDNILTISGSINRTNEVQEEQMYRRERFIGRFQRSVALPSKVISEEAKAIYRNGILEVRIPKARPETRRRVDIEFH